MIISIVIRYVGDLIDPSTITESLGVLPTLSYKKDEKFITPSGKERAARKGLWEWETGSKDDEGSCTDLDRYVAEIDAKFVHALHLLNQQTGWSHAWIDIHLLVDEGELQDGSVCYALSSESMNVLSKTGLKIEFSTSIVET